MTIQQYSLWIVVALCVERRLLVVDACSKERSVLGEVEAEGIGRFLAYDANLSRWGG